MTTTMETLGITRICICRLPELALMELDSWDTAITELDQALQDMATARQELVEAQAEMDHLEARAVLGIEGKNETERKAKLTLLLGEMVPYQDVVAEVRVIRAKLVDAERRVTILKERCRLHRAGVEVALADSKD